MSLRAHLDRYLMIRRSFGHDLGASERVLGRFVNFAESQGAQHISTDLFMKWRAVFGQARRETWAARLGMVRLFARWLHGLDPANEIPPHGPIPRRYRRSPPYIYSEEEIARIVKTAQVLPSVYGLRGHTFSTLFGLIAMTGLRISEALALDCEDVDLDLGVLTVRCGKGGNARLVPLHDSVTSRLAAYARERDRLLGFTPQPFFATERGTRPNGCSARYNFAVVCQRIGLRPAQKYLRHGRGPRIHDLRHSFAARTILGWYRTGKDPASEIIKLTTYLGHTKPENTYWYIEAVPELLELASQRVTGADEGEADL